MILWGVALAFFGLAVKEEGYPAWLGWTGVAAGAAVFILGAVQFLAPNVVFPGAVFYGGGTILSQLWTLIFGVAMWRGAGVGRVADGGHGAGARTNAGLPASEAHSPLRAAAILVVRAAAWPGDRPPRGLATPLEQASREPEAGGKDLDRLKEEATVRAPPAQRLTACSGREIAATKTR